MRYFKNSELIQLYGISDKAIRNWIESAQAGKVGLKLFEHGGKAYIADTLHNGLLIEQLVERGRKYRNHRSHRKLTPTQDFYDLFSSTQLLDIIESLDKYHEIPTHYRYFGVGGEYWDAYLHKLYDAGKNNTLSATLNLLQLEAGYLDNLCERYDFVNIVDVGPGNGLAAKGLIAHFHRTGKLKRYVAIDCSDKLLGITERNIRDWFDGSVRIERHLRDVTREPFGELIHTESFDEDADATMNIFLLLGGILPNFRDPDTALRIIRDSMGKNDLLILSDKLDTSTSRRFFDFNIEPDKTALSHRNKFLLDMLSIDESLYEVEQFFDEKKRARFIQVRLNVDLSINFKVNSFSKKVELPKGSSILLFRVQEYSSNDITDILRRNDFSQMRLTKSQNQDYVLMTSKIETGEHRFPLST